MEERKWRRRKKEEENGRNIVRSQESSGKEQISPQRFSTGKKEGKSVDQEMDGEWGE